MISTTSLGCLFQCLTTLPVQKFFLWLRKLFSEEIFHGYRVCNRSVSNTHARPKYKLCFENFLLFLLNVATGWLALAGGSEKLVSIPSSAHVVTQRPGHFMSPPVVFCWLFTKDIQAQFSEDFLICGGALEQCRHLRSARKQEVLLNSLGCFGKNYILQISKISFQKPV